MGGRQRSRTAARRSVVGHEAAQRRQADPAVRPAASSPGSRRRMQATGRRDTGAELAIRKVVHAHGLRYAVDARPLADLARRADLVFRGARVAVFIDGCFWHGCPQHATWPKANADFWRKKILDNRRRDRGTDDSLRKAGWLVIRAWEHEAAEAAAGRICEAVRGRASMPTPPMPRRAKRHE